jgi:hypothetical protein
MEAIAISVGGQLGQFRDDEIDSLCLGMRSNTGLVKGPVSSVRGLGFTLVDLFNRAANVGD